MAKKYILSSLAILAIAISTSALRAGEAFSKKQKEKTTSEPTLYLADPHKSSTKMFTADSNIIIKAISRRTADKLNLVIVTHGWYEKETWPQNLALAIKAKADPNKWLCGWYDWRVKAKVINPTEAAEYARDVAGPLLGEKIAGLSQNWRHIHLIGHSAGAWLINEAAKILTRRTNAAIHLTFLDAYVPPFWHENQLGDLTTDPNALLWADHYFTRDLTLGATEKKLAHAHNVDITKTDPGITDHRFPFYWYHATVLSRYADGHKYEDKELFHTAGDIRYGFARSAEAGPKNWKASLKLHLGNKAVKIKKNKKPFGLWLQELFKKQQD